MCAPTGFCVFSVRTHRFLCVFCVHPQVFVYFLCAPTGFCAFSVGTHRFLCVFCAHPQVFVYTGELCKFDEFSEIFDFFENFVFLQIFIDSQKILRKSGGEIIKWPDIFSCASKKVMSGCYSDVVSRVLSE